MPKATKPAPSSANEVATVPRRGKAISRRDDGPNVRMNGTPMTKAPRVDKIEVTKTPNPFVGPIKGGKVTAFQRRLEDRALEPGINLLTVNRKEGRNHGAQKAATVANVQTPTPMFRGRLRCEQRRDVDRMRARIVCLERSEQGLKKKIRDKAESFKDLKVELEETRTEWLRAEERLEDRDRLLGAIGRDLDRYRGWWLTEHYCLKVLLKLIPDSEKKGVEAIAASTLARFAEHSK